jgi:hypothetical protein
MPPRVEQPRIGCLVTSALCLVMGGCLLWITGWPRVGLGLAVIAVVVIGSYVTARMNRARLLRECQRVYDPRGIRFLVVYSESPTWEAHIRASWLPRFGEQAVVLNWTNRARWEPSLEVRLFKSFMQSERNFNPAVLVLRNTDAPLVYRFFYAFQQAKNGRPEYLARLEAELFTHVQSALPNPQSLIPNP